MRALIIDDHPIFARAVAQVVERLEPGAVADVATSAGELASCMLGGLSYDLVLLDLVLPNLAWEDALAAIRAQWPRMPVVALTAFESEQLVSRVMAAGASGYATKMMSADQLEAVLRIVLSGGRWRPTERLPGNLKSATERSDAASRLALLTERQRAVLRRVAHGRSNKEIARELEISLATVKLHVNAVLRALGVANRTEAASLFMRAGAADPLELSHAAAALEADAKAPERRPRTPASGRATKSGSRVRAAS